MFKEILTTINNFTEEKLFSKAYVIAESKFHCYTLIADAKSFGLSRTAKNQKDFKVTALSNWRGDNDYAVLCSPYFQYPALNSQIYSQALTHNVCLLSWEHWIFMIKQGMKEDENFSLATVWNFSESFSGQVLVSNIKRNFLPLFNEFIASLLNVDSKVFDKVLNAQILTIKKRGNIEKAYWIEEITRIKNYSREKAINELIKALKIYEKLNQIDSYIKGLSQ